MRVLVVGAGATGGYYGARLAEAGRDVTFLVRPARADKLAANGLVVESKLGDLHLAAPKTVTAAALPAAGGFDLVLLSCKAYDLAGALDDLGPAVGDGTAILPILNGMAHLDALDARFGAASVLGGSCAIAATLGPEGAIRHMSDFCTLTFGERDGSRSKRCDAIETLMRDVKFQPRLSDRIVLEMWEKWVFLATLAGATTLMRGTVGDIVGAEGGRDFIAGLHDECLAIAAANGFAPREKVAAQARTTLTTEDSPLTASMLRDIEGRGRIEADHVVGDLIARGRSATPDTALPHLERVFTGLKTYERRRAREQAA
ncbi:2-dehydropantoate 2-reductase [Methylobacterium sp. E-041]|uniref:2-dehydropantoate 2-reductase n=1 Tax=unclassified Methylobacterium TaxID=2615210 RepID=UPI001FBA85BE|nr:2-dehydropantoate 2-reductase [Methylobacterium sp. E-041]MCJ2104895.1 2-dehydropantoate 2-reductase [Methylobacterium sp. E-041]